MLSILLRQSTPPSQRLQDEAYPTPGSYHPPNAATADEPGQTKEEYDVPVLAQPQNWCSPLCAQVSYFNLLPYSEKLPNRAPFTNSARRIPHQGA